MAGTAKIETMQSFQSKLLANGLNTSELRNNDLLQKDEWIKLDEVVVKTANMVLNVVTDLKAAGLTIDLGGLGVLISQFETVSSMEGANVDLSGVTEGSGDTPEFNLNSVLIPIIHKDFFLNLRRLLASRRMGEALDTTGIAIATRLVAEALENLVFNGSSMVSGSAGIYGLFTHPSINDAGAPSGSWGTPANIFTDVDTMLGKEDADNFRGPFNLYIANNLWNVTRQDAKAYGDRTVLDRLLAYPEIASVKSSGVIADGKACLVQMTSDVVDLAVGQDIKPVQWDSKGGMQLNVKVLSAAAPRVKADHDGRSGICIIDNVVCT